MLLGLDRYRVWFLLLSLYMCTNQLSASSGLSVFWLHLMCFQVLAASFSYTLLAGVSRIVWSHILACTHQS